MEGLKEDNRRGADLFIFGYILIFSLLVFLRLMIKCTMSLQSLSEIQSVLNNGRRSFKKKTKNLFLVSGKKTYIIKQPCFTSSFLPT